MLKEGVSKYFFIGLIIAVAILSLLVAFPFLSSIIAGAILAYIFYPVYKWIKKFLKYKWVTAFTTSIIIIILITVPTAYIIKNLTKETHYMYIRTKQQLSTGEIIETRCYDDGFLCKTFNDMNKIMREENIKKYLLDRLNEALTYVTKRISNLIFSIPKLALYLLIVLFTTYYALKDGKEFCQRAAKVAPLKVHHQEQIFNQFSDVTHAVIYGSIIVALIQGVVGAFGLWLFGIKGFIWLGLAMTFFALIPFIGTWIIWLPISLFLGITGYLQGETGMIWRGIGLFLFGLLVISTVDNIVKPFIVAGRAKVHPLLVIIGIIGGLFAFGLIGIIIGPLVLALLQTLLEIYEREQKPHAHEIKTCILGRDGMHKKSRK
ncbi:AI-2E family transporter [Candidatus Woesearchaeota archaeon]|nr:AI-2E family transporter [Candidatus Woesearchaeota archaeon]